MQSYFIYPISYYIIYYFIHYIVLLLYSLHCFITLHSTVFYFGSSAAILFLL